MQKTSTPPDSDLALSRATCLDELPPWLTRAALAEALHHKMKPFEDSLEDVGKALDYALGVDETKYGGFVTLATRDEELLGAVVMLRTGMHGYIPPWILLMVFVDPALRGRGIGGRLIDFTRGFCDGDIKLHVEHDNPARRLYERIGFKSKYLEMRLDNG